MGIFDYLDEYLPSLGGVFGDANSSPPVPPAPANIPGGDSVPSALLPTADATGARPPLRGQTSTSLPQWLQTEQDSYSPAPPMAGLTLAQFSDRFGPVANESNSPDSPQAVATPSAANDTSRFDDAKFDPQTYAGRSASPSRWEHATYENRKLKGFGEAPIPEDGASAAYMPLFAQIESRGNPTQKNKSAAGLMQFEPDTWLGIMKKYFGVVPRDEEDEKRILDRRYDPALATSMAKILAAESAKALTDESLEITPSNVYLTHFLGGPRGIKVLEADPTTPVSSLLSERAIKDNKKVLQGKTAGEVINWSKDRIAQARKEVVEKPGNEIVKSFPGAAPLALWNMPSQFMPARTGTIDLSKLHNTLKTSGNPIIFLGR